MKLSAPWSLPWSAAHVLMSVRAVSRKASGQSGSAGSGQSAAQMTARQAAGGSCPPDVERRDVAVADRFFPAGVGRDACDGEVDFDQALGGREWSWVWQNTDLSDHRVDVTDRASGGVVNGDVRLELV